MVWMPYLLGHVLKRKKPLQSPSTMLLQLSLQPGKPHSHPTLPHWSRVWSKFYWSSHTPRLTTPSWNCFCLSCLSSALFFTTPPPLAQLPFLPLVSTASPCQLKALPSSPFLLPHSTTCPLSPDGFQLSFQSTCTGKPCLLLSRGGGALDGVSLLGDLFISPPIVIFPCSACWCRHNNWQHYYRSSCSCHCLLVIYSYCHERTCKHFLTSFLGQNRYHFMLL